ncbi:MAG: type I pullulanase [Bacteroidaceae bacterium]|nr:type I pullulanase [Bacteroidaceae bacterium]
MKKYRILNLSLFAIIVCFVVAFSSCSSKKKYASYNEYPIRSGSLTEMESALDSTKFMLWAPTADAVRLMLYDSGEGGHAYQTFSMNPGKEGTWIFSINKNLRGKFYTFDVKKGGHWLGETPGIDARAVGINGQRAAIIDMRATDPEGWSRDVRPALKSPADIIIYEMHHRDFSISRTSGIKNRGKFLALTEHGTTNPGHLKTGIDHLVELGITHVQLLPSFDFASIDESKLNENKYNWGYDPQNYNVPDGSYSTDPSNPITRIKEFKEMVEALHKAGIRVILDVVYNHTFNAKESNFERTVPGYFYRQNPDSTLCNASGCGNETASNRLMMRKFMIESVCYWANEYHIDGFRFDLMGIHDIETMNEIRAALNKIDPTIFVLGEGWSASKPALSEDSLAMKVNVGRMPGIAVFSDEMRDGLRGPFANDHQGGFFAGIPGSEESIKFGIVGGVPHPQINYDSVNYCKAPWALQPTQFISYISCHDDLCLVDRLKSCIPSLSPQSLDAIDKLGQTVVLTSQGVPFLYAGEEMMRDKKGVRNSFQSPDSINAIDWNLKTLHQDVFQYDKGLIALRMMHPAFRMGDAKKISESLQFLPVVGSNLIAYQLKDHANGDLWEDIIVAFNGRASSAKLQVPEGKYTVVCMRGMVNANGLGTLYGPEIYVPANSALIMYK